MGIGLDRWHAVIVGVSVHSIVVLYVLCTAQ